MAGPKDEEPDPARTKVQVFSNTRFADPSIPDDHMKGKRFTGTGGQPISLEDLLTGLVGKPTQKEGDGA